MNAAFADTSVLVAFLSVYDEHHALALNYMESFTGQIITTSLVLVELGNFLSKHPDRQAVSPFVHDLRTDPRVQIIPATDDLLDAGLALYADRPDKDWSLTDCISFVVMQRQNLTDAFTADHHFEQAGFRILLK